MFFELPSSITKSIILRHKNTYTILWNWVIPEKIQTGVGVGRGNTFLKKHPGIFWFVTLPLEIPEKTNFHPWKLVWPMKILHGFFLNTPGNSTFFNWPLEFSHVFSSIPLEIPCPRPSLFEFFWNGLFDVVFILNFTFAVFCCHEASGTLRFHNLVLIFSYLSCFQKVFT